MYTWEVTSFDGTYRLVTAANIHHAVEQAEKVRWPKSAGPIIKVELVENGL